MLGAGQLIKIVIGYWTGWTHLYCLS